MPAGAVLDSESLALAGTLSAPEASGVVTIEVALSFVLLVGGTMLYFKALFEGLDAMPAADARIRAELDAEAVQRGWPATS